MSSKLKLDGRVVVIANPTEPPTRGHDLMPDTRRRWLHAETLTGAQAPIAGAAQTAARLTLTP
jgi:hypothetical protein